MISGGSCGQDLFEVLPLWTDDVDELRPVALSIVVTIITASDRLRLHVEGGIQSPLLFNCPI